MNLTDPEVIHSEVMHPSEGTRVQLKGKVDFFINTDDLIIPQKPEVLSDDEIRAFVDEHPFKIVAATVGEDEHSVGLKRSYRYKTWWNRKVWNGSRIPWNICSL